MPERNFYGEGMTTAELAALAVAGSLEGVESEIAIMRLMVRKLVREGDIRAAREGMDALRGLLRLQHQLAESQVEHTVSNLDRVLDSLAEEMGVQV